MYAKVRLCTTLAADNLTPQNLTWIQCVCTYYVCMYVWLNVWCIVYFQVSWNEAPMERASSEKVAVWLVASYMTWAADSGLPFNAALVGPLYIYIHTYIHTYIHRTLDVLILYECTYGIGSEDSIYTGVRGKLWTNLEPSHHNIVQGQFALLGESIDHNCGLEHTCKLRRRAHLRKKTVATICELAHSSEQIRGSGNVPPSRSPRWWTCADPPALRHPRIAFRRPCRTGRLPPPERTECGGPGTWSWPPAAPAR